MKILVVIFFYFFGHFFLSNNLNAHSGRTNTEGCHNEKKQEVTIVISQKFILKIIV